MTRRVLWSLLAVGVLGAGTASAQISAPDAAGFAPRVPVSGLARPSLGIDPSRFHISTSVTVGSFGQNVSGLQVTSFMYEFRQPLLLNVRVGNAFGGGQFARGSSFFLEGLDLTFRPSNTFMIHVGYQDVRSPHQRGFANDPYAPFGSTRGY